MTGLEQFNQFFGDITLRTLLGFALAVYFVFYISKQVKDYLLEKQKHELKKAEIEQKRDKDLAEALEGVRQYPKYRQQSIEIQHKLEDENCEVRKEIKDLATRIEKMEEDTKRRERNKIRNTLMQNYRYYTNPETNPTHSWTRTERDTFWSLFKEYEENGGDGDMHTIVQPAMERLIIVEHETHITSK